MWIDGTLTLSYILFLLIIGWRSGSKQKSESYLLSGRSLTLPAMVATLVTTWYGGILGVGEFVYSSGLATWVVFGLPYYFFALLFAFFLAAKIRSNYYFSIPDILYKNYDPKTGLIGSFFILFLTTPAPYLFITGMILAHVFKITLIWAVIWAALFSTIYMFKGGFRAVVQTDKLQFLLMFGGFITLFVMLIVEYGSPTEIFKQLPAGHQDPTGAMPVQTIFVWFFIASWTFIDPGFHQRAAAAKAPSIARKGILISILFWFIFDMLTLWTGLYAVVLLPQTNPLMIYPELAELVLPPLFKGLFLLGLLATVMSTVDSFTFLSAQTIGRDLIAQWNRKNSSEETKHYTQLGLVITILMALALIALMPSVVQMWYRLGSLFIPPLLLPVLSALFPKYRIGATQAFIIMVSGFVLTTGWFFTESEGGFLWGLEPFIPGLILTGLLFLRFLIPNLKRE